VERALFQPHRFTLHAGEGASALASGQSGAEDSAVYKSADVLAQRSVESAAGSHAGVGASQTPSASGKRAAFDPNEVLEVPDSLSPEKPPSDVGSQFAPSEPRHGYDSLFTMGVCTPARVHDAGEGLWTPTKAVSDSGNSIQPPLKRKRKWLLKPEFGGPASSTYDSGQKEIKLLDLLGHKLQSPSMVLSELSQAFPP
ncbi:unnamed protein product, partial [Prorocentrum cordatum]